jgi:hypothetical protein
MVPETFYPLASSFLDLPRGGMDDFAEDFSQCCGDKLA